MNAVKTPAYILATITQTFILFNILTSGEKWSLENHHECCELIARVVDLRRELAAMVGDEQAFELVKQAYTAIFAK